MTARGLSPRCCFATPSAEDISQPIDHDGREHIGCVPTQLAPDYFGQMFRLAGGERLDGIVYRSAEHAGEKAFALYRLDEQRIDAEDESGANALLSFGAVAHP